MHRYVLPRCANAGFQPTNLIDISHLHLSTYQLVLRLQLRMTPAIAAILV